MIRPQDLYLIGASNHIPRSAREKTTDLQKSMKRRWHNPDGKTRPVFLVGCGRSGTTMLVHKLASTWQVESYNEDNPEAFQKWHLRDLSVVENLVTRCRAPIALFKPILDTYRAEQLLSYFPKAKVIFAFRHYHDVINSMLKMKRWRKPRLALVESWISTDFAEFDHKIIPEETREFIRGLWQPSLSLESGAALYWLFYNRLFFDLNLDCMNRVRLARYESIVASPEEAFNSLCLFLDIDYDPLMIEGIHSSSVKLNSSPMIDEKIQADCEILWQCLCLAEREG